ncbi:hypothetical protein BH11MYX1_BH11MYX1_08470 [soil metagenome]
MPIGAGGSNYCVKDLAVTSALITGAAARFVKG